MSGINATGATYYLNKMIEKLKKPVAQPTTQQVRVITLNENEHSMSVLYRFEKGWIVEFQLGPSLFGRNIILSTNHPPHADTSFQRNKYYPLKWFMEGNGNSQENKITDDTRLYARIQIVTAGSFSYTFGEESKDTSIRTLGSGYFSVMPVLCVGNNEVIDLDSIQCQTVLAKCLGPFNEWEGRLYVSKESGYNMIHFTPVQELGGSNSCYCLKDQLKLNPAFTTTDNKVPTYDDLLKLISKIDEQWGVLSVGDVVLNHTANESPWILEHTECSYNMVTAPHLIPAAILDGYLHVFTKEVARGKLSHKGIPAEIYTEEHLQAIKYYLETEIIPKIHLEEYYTCDVEKLCKEFKKLARNTKPADGNGDLNELKFINTFCGRNKATLDFDLALSLFNRVKNNCVNEAERLSECIESFKQHLLQMNRWKSDEIRGHLTAALNNCIANMRYFRVQNEGPKIREVSEINPLVPRYFTGKYLTYESVEKEVHEEGQFVMAHNGWLLDCSDQKNFADKDSNVYLRREMIAWSDTVKLRYGECYEDCPFLWDHMKEYIEINARIFHGIRLDNCHSTPLPVAEYLLDCARRVRPDLYVMAELFTNSDARDNVFINRLGITSIVREAMSAWNSQELGRLVYRYGGEPVGSFRMSAVQPAVPKVAHAIFYDVTHDNQCPIEKKSVFDSLPCSAVVTMASCAFGSSRGFDELVPHHIDVVKEERLYTSWTNSETLHRGQINSQTGLISAKAKLNALHKSMNDYGFSQVFVDQMTENVVAVTRFNPVDHRSYVLVAYTAFSYPSEHGGNHSQPGKMRVEGVCTLIIFESSLVYNGQGDRFSKPDNFEKDSKYINGLLNYKVDMRECIELQNSSYVMLVPSDDPKYSEFEFTNKFMPGSVIILAMSPHATIEICIERINHLVSSLFEQHFDNLIDIITKMDLRALNYALYRCSEEGVEDGIGAYHVPGYGDLVYCGLQGFASLLDDIRYNNDLGHPFCKNLREGDWILDYIIGRLKFEQSTRDLGTWFDEVFQSLRRLPRYVIPCYFDAIISSVTKLLLSKAAFQMSAFVRNGSKFTRALAMGSVQCVGSVKSVILPPFSPNVEFANKKPNELTMCAGLPHFAIGYMRSWGRDTFISLRGLLLITGRYEEARSHILGYASCLRHGLIPNLLDSGTNARFNCRDAVWWWLYSIVSYIQMAPEGAKILSDSVSRMYPTDDSAPLASGTVDQPLSHVMQEALSVHFQGLSYRERNAGPAIDENMTDAGFNNEIGVDLNTGFIYGGNEFNCGTWMDKMGSSSVAGNRGRPATPRDGSAVELVGLSKAVLRELAHLHDIGLYPFGTVKKRMNDGKILRWTFREWEGKIADNFETKFWVNPVSSDDDLPDESKWVNRRGIYKDSFGATQRWADYQLRCNFLVALTVAPEMAQPARAWLAIKTAEEILLGPLGIKTLDPNDWNYRGDYHNNDNSDDPKVAHGFNYHQGPEWVWPVGFFLRAKLHFAKLRGSDELCQTIGEIKYYLRTFYQHIMTSHWRGLPELTNSKGAHCSDGCSVQAWSMSCILEVLYDMEQLSMS